MKILVVDDEQDICEILQYNLETEGYEVDTAYSAEEALDMMHFRQDHSGHYVLDSTAEAPEYGLILLDVMMGEMSGFQMARRLKDTPQTAAIPIIFTTALDSEDNTVKGLNIGADDYMAKPLSLKEVKARVKAVLRRTDGARQSAAKTDGVEQTDGCVDYQGLHIDVDRKSVTVDGEAVALTKIELELLSFLVRKAGKVYSREELLRRCWPSDTYVLDRTVDVNITRLRKKIGHYGALIKTRIGYGYTFDA